MSSLDIQPDLPSMSLLLGRQLAALDAWNDARRLRERSILAGSTSREERLLADRRVAVLECAHAAVLARADAAMDGVPGPIPSHAVLRAVVAHRHPWLVDKLSTALAARDVLVIAASGNGAEALGIVVAEQPDLLVVGDALVMMTAAELLGETARVAPYTARAAVVDDSTGVGAALEEDAQSVFVRQMPPDEVADGLMLLLREQI